MNLKDILKWPWIKKPKEVATRINTVEDKADRKNSTQQNYVKKATGTEHVVREKTKIQGWQTQFDDVPRNAKPVQVIIGLDFGTAFTKVTISGKGQRYGVPLNENKQGIDKYLLPTRIYEDSTGQFAVARTDNRFLPHVNLKMRILDNNLDSDTRIGITTYIAWVLQKSRTWLMTEKQPVFGLVPLKWEVNVGLPTEKYNDKKLRKIYKELVGDAWTISTTQYLTGESGKKPNNVEFALHPDRIEAFPEFVAQIQGYISSPQRKPGIHALVDVGACTIDTTVFIVHQNEEGDIFPILAKSVKRLGTTYLATHRCRKLGQSDNWKPSPQDKPLSSDEFIKKFGVTSEKLIDVDKKFKKKVMKQINSCFAYTKERMAPLEEEWETGIPLLMCGGGARVEFYGEITRILTAQGHGYHLHNYQLPPLDNLDAPGILDKDLDRLSVAHGLSFDAFEIGKITNPPPFPLKNKNPNQGKSKCPSCNGTGGGYANCPKCGGSGIV